VRAVHRKSSIIAASGGFLATKPEETLATAACNLRNFLSIHDRGLGFPIFRLIFVWEAPIETRILDRYSSTGAKVRVKWIYYVTVAGEDVI
jgi:hypothetical protein